MGAILAILLMVGRSFAIIALAHSQQIIPIGGCSASASAYTHLSVTKKLNSRDGCFGFTFRLSHNTVLSAFAAYTYAKYLGTSASHNTSFSFLQPNDLNCGSAVNFRNSVVFARNNLACYSLTYAYSQAVSFKNCGKINGKINHKSLVLLMRYHIVHRSESDN